MFMLPATRTYHYSNNIIQIYFEAFFTVRVIVHNNVVMVVIILCVYVHEGAYSQRGPNVEIC